VVAVVNPDAPMPLYDFTDVIAFGGQSTLGLIVARHAARRSSESRSDARAKASSRARTTTAS
jgi:hypothetical protein